MKDYLILRNPGHNHVFFQNSAHLALKELELTKLPIENIALTSLADISYLKFSAPTDLTPDQLETIARLSATYALFQVEQENLKPILLPNPQVLDRSLGTILKYQGKTNEIFTRMLLNIALAQGNFNPKEIKLLDPVAGKGTTLFEAFALGADVYGVEVLEKSTQEGMQHLKKFLEQGKIKHRQNSIRVSGANKSFTGKKHTIDMNTQHFELISTDSKYCKDLFSQKTFHIILGDLPYGVQHGNQAGGKHRSPAQLLNTCLRGWHTVLKDQGILLLSWNLNTLPREQMESLLEKNNFTPLQSDVLNSLEHQVDASILRDIILAKKTK